MRILLISETTRPYSGWGTYTQNTLLELVRRKHDVLCVLRTESDVPLCKELIGLPSPLSLMESRIARLKSAWIIWRAIRHHRPDVIHILIEPYALAMPLVRLLGRLPPWVMNFHGTYSIAPFMHERTRFLARKAYQQASRFLACSQYTSTQVLSTLTQFFSEATAREMQAKTTFFRLGIVSPSISVSSPQRVSSKKHILFVGELKSRKGVMELLHGFHAFVQKNAVLTTLTLIGQYDPESLYILDMQSYIRTHGLQSLVRFTGRATDAELQQAYALADVFVMLSKKDGMHFEGFGLVFLEANARGIPVIGSMDSGCKEAIAEGVSGYAVDAFDPMAIAERLQWILVDKRIAPEECKAWAQRHSIDQQVDSIAQVYREVTAPQG